MKKLWLLVWFVYFSTATHQYVASRESVDGALAWSGNGVEELAKDMAEALNEAHEHRMQGAGKPTEFFQCGGPGQNACGSPGDVISQCGGPGQEKCQ